MHVTPVTSFDTIDNSVIIVVFTVDIYAFGGDLNRTYFMHESWTPINLAKCFKILKCIEL